MRKTVIILASAALLSACGGGGDGGGVTSAGPAAPISAANQEAVAQDALGTSFQLLDSAAQSPLVAAVVTDERALMRRARAEMAKLPTYIANAPKAVAGAVFSEQANCTSGGTVVVTANDADNNSVLSQGDSLAIAFNSCGEGAETLNGTLAFSVGPVSGTVGVYPYSGEITMSFGNLTLSGAGYSFHANGSVTLQTAVNGVNAISEGVSAPSLTMSATYAGVTRSRSLNGYIAVHDRTPDATYTYLDAYTGGGMVTGSNTLASVSATFTTPIPFVRRAADLYPYVGQMVLTGMNNSKLRITAEDNDSVMLEVDADGDGAYESSTPNVPWSTIVH